jgi:tetratricopeptide (TPR) repeat protein
VTHVLRRHEYADVRQLYLEARYTPRLAHWGLVSMALFREEPEPALQFLDEASPADGDPNLVLEENGPWPFREGWRRAFQRGTCLLLVGGRDAEAEAELGHAEQIEPRAEGANNLGVALARQGRVDRAQTLWNDAERRFPGYLDARLNCADPGANRITTHPLRRQASRSEY